MPLAAQTANALHNHKVDSLQLHIKTQ